MRHSDDSRRRENPRFPARNHSWPNKPLSANRAIRVPYKGELCLLFQRGKCLRGQNCHFAHSLAELRNPPAAFAKERADEDWNIGKRYNYCPPTFKTLECCRYFVRGVDCPHGKRCQYPHKYPDDSGFRKQKICWEWEKFGSCPFGLTCIYSHGRNGEVQEMSGFRPRPDNAAESSDEGEVKITKKLRLMDRSYFRNWDIARISQIYADNPSA